MYFETIPKIKYLFEPAKAGSGDVSVLLTDITKNVRFKKDVIDKITLYDYYIMKDGDTFEIISEKLYGTPMYHWILMLLNEKYDWRIDAPLNDNIFDEYLIEKYGYLGFVDSSNNDFDLKSFGNVRITKTVSKFGTASGYFKSEGQVNSYLTIPKTTAFDFGVTSVTFETWLYILPDTYNSGVIMGNKGSFIGLGQWSLYYSNNSLKFSINSISESNTLTGSFDYNKWYHVAVVRSGSTYRMFIDGKLVQSKTILTSSQIGSSLYDISIGASINGTTPMHGFLGDLRITKGIARYSTTFTPPNAALPNQQCVGAPTPSCDSSFNNVLVLLKMDETNTVLNKTKTTIKHYVNSNGQIVDSTYKKEDQQILVVNPNDSTELLISETSSQLDATPVTIYNWEEQLNIEKRKIKIVSSEIIDLIVSNYKDLM